MSLGGLSQEHFERTQPTRQTLVAVPDCKVFTVQGTVPRDLAFTQALCAAAPTSAERLDSYVANRPIGPAPQAAGPVARPLRPGLSESLRVFRSCPLITPKDAQSSLQMLAMARYGCALRLDRSPFERAARSRPKNSQALRPGPAVQAGAGRVSQATSLNSTVCFVAKAALATQRPPLKPGSRVNPPTRRRTKVTGCLPRPAAKRGKAARRTKPQTPTP